MPATFWTLAFLILPENAAHRQRVLQDIKTQAGALQGDQHAAAGSSQQPVGSPASSRAPSCHGGCTPETLAAAIVKLSLDRKSFVGKCAAEALRLRVPSIDVRIASSNLQLSTSTQQMLRIPKGTILAICPFESHHDAGFYGSDPWEFNPDRKGLSLGDGTAVVPGVSGRLITRNIIYEMNVVVRRSTLPTSWHLCASRLPPCRMHALACMYAVGICLPNISFTDFYSITLDCNAAAHELPSG